MTTRCKYCNLLLEQHNMCQERACHSQFIKHLMYRRINKLSIDNIINHRWEFHYVLRG